MDTTPTTRGSKLAPGADPKPERPNDPIDDVLAMARSLDLADSAEAMLAEMRALEAANSQAEKTLASQGVALDQASLLRVRLEELVEYVLGPIERDEQLNWQRIDYELRLQQRFARELDGVAGQVARVKLTAPGSVPVGPALIVPGR
jgi:hypothetical protein